MASLSRERCVPCRGGESTLNDLEIEALGSQVPEWQVVEEQGEKRLRRAFRFANFREALNFAHAVGLLAEEQDHHPVLVTEWGRVTVTWWTHAIGGLHRNDFVMAARTDDLNRGRSW